MSRKPTKRSGSKQGQQAEGIRLLLAGQSAPDVAAELSVHVSTVKRWKGLEAYTDALAAKEAKVADAIESDGDRLAALATGGIKALVEMLADLDDLEPPDRVRVIAEVRQWTIGNKHRVAGDPDNDAAINVSAMSEAQMIDRIMELEKEDPGLILTHPKRAGDDE